MARVTVVIAARDAASTLPATLASLARQTYPDWDAILVDDGSVDGTGELARSFGDRVRVLRHEVPVGPAASRNRGVQAASTELVASLDADDRWTPEYLTQQLKAYDAARTAGRRVGLVCTDAWMIDATGRACGRWSDRIRLPDAPVLEDLLRENFVYNSVLIPRELFLKHGGYAEDLTRGEDFDLWLRLVQDGNDIIVNPQPLAIYRLRPDALSADARALAAATTAVYERSLARGRLSPQQQRLVRRQVRLHALLERRAARSESSGSGLDAVIRALALGPVTLRVALEHPERWRPWLQRGPRKPAAGRHA